VQQRNAQRALENAKKNAGLDGTAGRLSWHSLRHSFASALATDAAIAPTTLAKIIGHADAGFTMRAYAKDGRDQTTLVEDVLKRAALVGIGG
jgi:integrase